MNVQAVFFRCQTVQWRHKFSNSNRLSAVLRKKMRSCDMAERPRVRGRHDTLCRHGGTGAGRGERPQVRRGPGAGGWRTNEDARTRGAVPNPPMAGVPVGARGVWYRCGTQFLNGRSRRWRLGSWVPQRYQTPRMRVRAKTLGELSTRSLQRSGALGPRTQYGYAASFRHSDGSAADEPPARSGPYSSGPLTRDTSRGARVASGAVAHLRHRGLIGRSPGPRCARGSDRACYIRR